MPTPRVDLDEQALAPATPHHTHVRLTTRPFFWLACLGLALLALNLWSTIFATPQVWAAPAPSTILLKGAPSKPNTESPTAGATSLTQHPQPATPGSGNAGTPQTIMHSTKVPMLPGSVVLQVGKATSLTSSDKRLDVQIPAGAITTQDLTAAGGKISLQLTQIAPASGSSAGGSGEFSLGTYLVQVVDAQGHLLTHGLRKPLVVRYHSQPGEQSLALGHTYLLLNSPLSQGATAMPGVARSATNASLASTMGSRQIQSTTLDPTGQTLTVSPLISTPSSSLSFNGDSPVATFGKPDPSSVNLSAGALSYGESLDLPAGPGGLTPPVSLSYSSESVNEQHNLSAAAGWVGEGWSLSVGEISWSESNVLAGCAVNTCKSSSTEGWESSWNISDPYGTSSQLIPPNINVASYYDETGNTYCGLSNPSVACPILWHTATESHDKIYMYVGPNSIPSETVNPPCWRVWLPNGIMEEFGCTADSLQYFYVAGGKAEVTGWYLDLITDPQGNQIHFTYQRDLENWKDTTTNTTYSYPRDVELASVQYDSPACLNAQTMCTGSSWAPQMQVVFNASHTPTILTGSTPTNCDTGTNLRCDDPVSITNGYTPSLIQNTFVLNTIQTQVRTSGTGTWNTLATYKLGYEQSGLNTETDPASGQSRSVAGMLDLTQIQRVGSDGSTALPTVQFSYTSQANAYVDSFFKPASAAGCGPSWNTGNGSGCLLWEANSLVSSGSFLSTPTSANRFLASISNGQGLAQSLSWAIAHDNSHGTPGQGNNNPNPFTCDSSQSGYPCNEADDSGWSHAVLISESDQTVRLTQNGQGGTQTSTPITVTTTYTYLLNGA